jgi:1,4-dihydroxy-2-naphthoate polyprenyltransferase
MMRPWWLAIRPKTLSASIAPVVVATALAWHDGAFRPVPALAALIGALLIQIGTNFSNDVLDFRRGADHAERLGPTRVTQAGLLAPRTVALGAAAAYGFAALIGVYLVSVAGVPILILGAAAIVSGVLYTAGPLPLAYVGLGDLFVLLFFGLAAVAGTYYVQALAVTPSSLALGVAEGALAVGILTVNNLRDVDSDRATGKRTLAVRIGAPVTRRYYSLVVACAFIVPVVLVAVRLLGWPVLVVLVALPQAVTVTHQVLGGTDGRALNHVLAATSRMQMLHAALLVVGLVVDGWLLGRMPPTLPG